MYITNAGNTLLFMKYYRLLDNRRYVTVVTVTVIRKLMYKYLVFKDEKDKNTVY